MLFGVNPTWAKSEYVKIPKSEVYDLYEKALEATESRAQRHRYVDAYYYLVAYWTIARHTNVFKKDKKFEKEVLSVINALEERLKSSIWDLSKCSKNLEKCNRKNAGIYGQSVHGLEIDIFSGLRRHPPDYK
jgi:hypothetical protein